MGWLLALVCDPRPLDSTEVSPVADSSSGGRQESTRKLHLMGPPPAQRDPRPVQCVWYTHETLKWNSLEPLQVIFYVIILLVDQRPHQPSQ